MAQVAQAVDRGPGRVRRAGPAVGRLGPRGRVHHGGTHGRRVELPSRPGPGGERCAGLVEALLAVAGRDGVIVRRVRSIDARVNGQRGLHGRRVLVHGRGPRARLRAGDRESRDEQETGAHGAF